MYAHTPSDEYREKSLNASANGSARTGRAVRGRRLLTALGCAALGCALGFGLATTSTPVPWGPGRAHETCVAHFDVPRPPFELEDIVAVTVTRTVHAPAPTLAAANQAPLLNGPPTDAFKDNLRPDVKYITTWPGSGWTNDVVLYMNLLYLAIITERVAVIPYFTPTHVGKGNAPPIPFGEVFDIPRLENELGTRILEWHQVKDVESEEVDAMGCWSVWKGVQSFNTEAHFTSFPGRFNLDVSYTTVPNWVKLMPGEDGDPHANFWALASLTFPETRDLNLQPPTLSPIHGASIHPEDQLVCFDYLYYVGATSPYEWEADYSGAWRFVGKHMHWAPSILKLAEHYVREALVIAPYEPTPPYIAVHVRHGDFAGWCSMPLKDCFAPLSAIARRVEEVQDELWETKRIVVDRVIVTSDEEDSSWWDEVIELGWVRPDHTFTAERHGLWYPILLDAAIQSGAAGFVGTDRSTVSVMARRRVESWQQGPTRMVSWGEPGADDH